MEQKDYYQILGVDRKAGQKEIKAGYRKLAFEYHPDRNRGNPHASAKMKEVNESYAVLSEPEKRKRYDALYQTYGSSAHEQFRQAYSEEDIFRGSDIQQIFEELSKAFGFRGFDEVFRESYGAGYRTFEFQRPGAFGRVFVGNRRGGNGFAPRSPLAGHLGRIIKYGLRKRWGIELPERGRDLQDVITISPAFAGTGGKMSYLCRKTARELLVSVPPGMRTGQKIRLKGMGEDGRGGGEPGDIYVLVRIRNPLFQKIIDSLRRIFPGNSGKRN